jgi:lipoprotein-anchoring transpeptidase ErfK/SrfK
MTILRFKSLFLGLIAILILSVGLAACGDTPTATPASVSPSAPPATTAVATTQVFPTTAPATTPAVVNPLPTVTGAPTTAVPTTAAPTTANVTTAPATTAAPATGTLLAYIDAGSLNIIDSNGNNKKTLFAANGHQLATGRPDWSPDNKSLAVAVQFDKGASQLFVVGVNGESHQLISAQPGSTSDTDPRWSPDGKTILFTRTSDNNKNGQYEPGDPHEVWLVDQDGLNPRKLAAGQQASWAPDGKRIAYVTNGTIKPELAAPQDNALHLINAQGQNDWEPVNVSKIPGDLTAQGYPFGPSTIFLQYPTWLDGGKTIGFTTIGHSGLVITINASTGRDLKVWDTQYEGGFGTTDSDAKGTLLTYQAFPPSGYSTVRLINTNGTPNLEKFGGLNIGGPQEKAVALYPALTDNGGATLAYFKVSGSDATANDLKSLTGSLVITTLPNGAGSAPQEKELLTGNIQTIVWSK